MTTPAENRDLPLLPHARFELENPKYAVYAAEVHQVRVDRGLPPQRAFPCPGTLQTIDRAPGVVIVRCDECHFEVGIPSTPPRPAVNRDRFHESESSVPF